jgi:outer membrane murein-binding lipoprotein Lpp
MVDIDYNALLASYQKKVTELINQNIVYEAKINALSTVVSELNERIKSLEKEIEQQTETESESFE